MLARSPTIGKRYERGKWLLEIRQQMSHIHVPSRAIDRSLLQCNLPPRGIRAKVPAHRFEPPSYKSAHQHHGPPELRTDIPVILPPEHWKYIFMRTAPLGKQTDVTLHSSHMLNLDKTRRKSNLSNKLLFARCKKRAPIPCHIWSAACSGTAVIKRWPQLAIGFTRIARRNCRYIAASLSASELELWRRPELLAKLRVCVVLLVKSTNMAPTRETMRSLNFFSRTLLS